MSKKPPPRVRRASEANDAVERILAETARLWDWLGDIPEGRENAARLRRGVMPQWPPAMEYRLSATDLMAVTDHAARYAAVDLWRKQGRVAYDLHPEMAATLYRADLKGQLPGGLFSRLPHINPAIPLPRPWPYRGEKGQKGLIRAFFLTGRTGLALAPTTDPRSEGLLLMAWIDLLNKRMGEYGNTVTPFFVLPSADEPFSLDDVIETTNAWHGTKPDEGEKRLIRQIIPGALSVLTYLCCDNRDVVEPADPAPRGKRRQAPSRDPFFVQVGWKIGPKLHATRMRAQGRSRDGVSVPSGVEQGPQHRAGHFRRVPFGPGRSQSTVKWIDPYWTKLDTLEEGQEPATQVVPVDHQRRDPSGHRDVKLANLGTAKAKEIRDRETQRAREDDWDW